jgi:hypothetical protein
MNHGKNVCLIDAPAPLAQGFRELGCSVVELRASPAPLFSLPRALEETGFTPDLIFQAESLDTRSLVTGLDQFDCPALNWCLDPHLNGFWQAAWARLFDLTCTTQGRWLGDLRERGAKDVRVLPWFGRKEPWTDVADRTTDVAFVGRVTSQRPARQWLVDFLRQRADGFTVAVRDGLAYGEMLALYRDSKIIPNESILGEINLRLFEGASCGCLVLDQDLGGEQAGLFEPGREIDTCAHAAELDHKLGFYLANPRLVRAMGRAAYERVRAEHLPVHRARRILEYAADAAGRRARGAQADKWTALTLACLWEAGRSSVPAGEVLKRLADADQDGDVATAVLRVQASSGRKGLVDDNLAAILGGQLYADDPALNLTGSMAALHRGHFDGAKAFRYRHCLATDRRDPHAPRDPVELLTFWAKDLHREGKTMRGGFNFDPEVHLPGSAVDCMVSILAETPQHLPTLRLLDTMLRPVTGMEQARVGFLSILTLREREDWRLALEIGLADLKSFRLESGLEELRLARRLAGEQGQGPQFDRVLAARDPSGLLAARLG